MALRFGRRLGGRVHRFDFPGVTDTLPRLPADTHSITSGNARFWAIAGIFIGGVSAIKGIRLPNRWSATQAQVDYSVGFVKRGLFGQVMRILDIPIGNYWIFAGVSFCLIAILSVLLVRRLWTSGYLRCIDNGMAGVVFLSSFSVSYLFHLVGYLEIPLAICALIVAGSSRPAPAACVAGMVGVLVHEMYAIVFLPLTLLIAFFEVADADNVRRAVRLMLKPLAVGVVVGVELLLIACRRPGQAQLILLVNGIQTRVSFPLRGDFFEIFERSFAANIKLQWGLAQKHEWWEMQLFAALAFMPTAIFFIWISWRAIGMRYGGLRARALRCAICAASFAPLLLNAIGWDIYRWYALMTLDAFIVSTIVCRRCLADHSITLEFTARQRNAAIVLIALNMATGVGFLDGRQLDTFPFDGKIHSAVRLIRGRLPMSSE
jgi:hypothetical protein